MENATSDALDSAFKAAQAVPVAEATVSAIRHRGQMGGLLRLVYGPSGTSYCQPLQRAVFAPPLRMARVSCVLSCVPNAISGCFERPA